MILPNSKTRTWFQHNRSDILGTLWSSFNLNLTEQFGKTRVSPRMMITTNGIADFGTPVAFRMYETTNMYCVAGTKVFKSAGGLLETPFAADDNTNTPGAVFSADYSDMETFNNNLFVTTATDGYYKLAAGTWTNATGLLTPNTNHKLLHFKRQNRLYMMKDLMSIISMDTSFTTATSGTYTFTVPSTDYFMTSYIETQDYIWILTGSNFRKSARIYAWDGKTVDTFSAVYNVDVPAILAGIVKDSVPYVMDCLGRLLYFNGGAFVPAPNGQLPVKLSKHLKNSLSQKNDRWIHPNGMMIENGRINILINNEYNDSGSTIEENLPSGVWEYDPNVGWYHKRSLSKYDIGAPSITDYGQNRISRVGALVNFNMDDTAASNVGTLIAGADYFVDGSTTKSASFINDSLDLVQKYGYIVTTKIMSQSAQSSWERIFLRVRKMLSSTDTIWVKYRTDDVPPTEGAITWVSSNSFTSALDLSGYSIGDEVEGTQGGGSGRCAHITSITNNSGTYTVTLDSTLGQSSGATAKARFQHWKLLNEPFSNQTLNLAQFGSMGASPWIQLKFCFLWTGNNEFYDALLINGTYQ